MAAELEDKLEFFPASRPTGTGVIVLPGGGYSSLSTGHEGADPARWLNGLGIDAWVLRYTVTGGPAPPAAPVYPRPLEDAAAAVRAVRRSGRVRALGLWGFSAGAHLAVMTGTATTEAEAADHGRSESSSSSPPPAPRVDFLILAYPVISMEDGPATHKGSVAALLGPDADAAQRRALTPSTRVTAATPPVFLFHTADDPHVPVQNTLQFAAALAAVRRPFAMLVLPSGRHGVGFPLDGDENAHVRWDGELTRWLRGFVDKVEVGVEEGKE